jgi:hypothetical protein
MPEHTFCTIVTPDYLPMALALYDSIRENGDAQLHVLISSFRENEPEVPEGVTLSYIDDLLGFGISEKIYEKYFNYNADMFRWSMKSEFILYLITVKGFKKVIFTDPDTYYFGSYDFLFEMLNSAEILLTPHWRSFSPENSTTHFHLNFTDGFFNGGFMAVSENGKNDMMWLSEVCLYECVKDSNRGLYDDQKYLDALPVMFEGVKILRHKGCNVAVWNIHECPRSISDGNVMICGEFPVVFVHFSTNTVKGIFHGDDPLLQGLLIEYIKCLDIKGFPIKDMLLEGAYELVSYISILRISLLEELESIRDIQHLLNGGDIAIFGMGRAGMLCYEYTKKYFPRQVKYFIDDRVRDPHCGIPAVTTQEFLSAKQNDVGAVICGKYQDVNPELINGLNVPFVRLGNVK